MEHQVERERAEERQTSGNGDPGTAVTGAGMGDNGASGKDIAGNGATDKGVAASPRRQFKRAAEVVLLGVILLAGTNWGWREFGHVGREQQITLSWECSNGIQWTDGSGRRWHVTTKDRFGGDSSRLQPMNAPAPGQSQGPGFTKVAKGTIHFDSRDEATFRSDTGGSIQMARVREGQMFEMSCSM